MSSPPVLELSDATVVKDDRHILDRLRLTIHEGEHTAILGPNGAGKSALVRLLAHEDRALLRPDGRPAVRVFGSDTWDVFELRAQLGIVSADLHQRFVFGSNEGRVTAHAAVLSAFFASHGIIRYGVVTDHMRRLTDEALDRMGVRHLAARRLDEMSSGEARRVLLARALVTSPRALLLDEPTTGLDLIARHGFMERVRRLAQPPPDLTARSAGDGVGATLILITHHIEEIFPEIERVVLLQEGKIAASGDKRSVLTSDRLSALFGAPVALDQEDGYYYARPLGSGKFEV